MKKSAAIIGGGLGGLMTGAILSKEGVRVTVIEKNPTIGGGLQNFTRFGVSFDTGMHVFGGMQEGGSARKILEYLGLWDKIDILPVDPDCIDEIHIGDDIYRISSGRKAFVDSLSVSFPLQRQNLAAYTDAVFSIAEEVDLFRLRPTRNLFRTHSEDFTLAADKFIAKYISDKSLRAVLAYMNPFYGGEAGVTPAYIHALISALYIEGPCRFVGGSQKFADAIADFIRENGGAVIAGDAVVRVRTEGRFIKGLCTSKGQEISADKYICAIHPCTFFGLLDDPSALPKSYRDRLNSLPNSNSAFKLNIKFKPQTFKYINHSCYYVESCDDVWNSGNWASWPHGFMYSTPPESSRDEYATKMIVTAPMSWDCVRKWEHTSVGHRGDDYATWKKVCADKVLDRLERVIPDIRSCIEAMDTSSPLTIRDWYGVKEGSMCGFSKDCDDLIRSQVPVVTKISNLMLTGQGCNLHGLCGVLLTSINTSEAVLEDSSLLERISEGTEFDDLRPFRDWEINAAMRRITDNPLFPDIASYAFPDSDLDEIRKGLAEVNTVREFQHGYMYKAIRKIMDSTISGFTYGGFPSVRRDSAHLYVSNHRDIALDASIMETVLLDNGLDTTEITFGANLMQGELVVDIGKSNKMFKVERPGTNAAEFYRASVHLSDYIRTAICGRGNSIWIANRNGRTKDGIDRTDQGIIKMFGMSGPQDKPAAIAALGIIPVSISYEWEPCDFLKAAEMYRRQSGPYIKKKGEDLHSILTGMMQQKGRVHLEFCPELTFGELSALDCGKPNMFYKGVATLMDKRICSAYKLFPNNYIAWDLLHGGSRWCGQYDDGQKAAFLSHIGGLSGFVEPEGLEEARKILLGIYANPVDSKMTFNQDEAAR